jgi:hypothetical protein
MKNLTDILYELETARPLIFIENLVISSNERRQVSSQSMGSLPATDSLPSVSGVLTLNMDVVGYQLAGEQQ